VLLLERLGSRDRAHLGSSADERRHRVAERLREALLDALRHRLIRLLLTGEDHVAARAEARHVAKAHCGEVLAQLHVRQAVPANVHPS
jgi:hypothetical protein